MSRYKGLATPELIERLRQDGHNVTWYVKHSDNKLKLEADKCGFFTVYLLEGEWAYTLTYTSEPYQRYTKLKKPEVKPCYYCSACKERFPDRDAAAQHRLIRNLDQK